MTSGKGGRSICQQLGSQVSGDQYEKISWAWEEEHGRGDREGGRECQKSGGSQGA